MSDNPIKYSDFFDFSDDGGIKSAIRDINKLKKAYKEFADSVSTGTFKMITDQQKLLAESVKQLADASAQLNITQKAQQTQLLENASAMSKLEAQSRLLTEAKKAAKTTDDAVKGSVDQLNNFLREEIKQYNALVTAKSKDTATTQRLVQSINNTRAQISNLNSAIKQNVTAFTSAQGSYNRLDAETKKLIVDLKALPNAFTTNAAKAREMQNAINGNVAKLKEFDKAMNITTRNVGNYSSAFNQIGGSIQSMIGPVAIFTAALAGIKKIVSTNAEISDSLADVRRTAQLTEAESSKLLNTLKQFDTRTSLKGLLDIAIIAGQLGIAKKDIAGFTQSIDQLAVVLSGEIPGGAEEVATALGKINGVFKTQALEGTNISEAYNKTGSAILALGQVGLATGGYLQDFALRTAGVAQTAKISLPTILAYSAVLEETGSSAEVAGTAFNRLVGSLASKREKFFAIAKLADANLTIGEFTDIINTDANKALQLFFQGLNKSQNLTQFIDLLGEIKIKAGPAQNAIIALAQNQEKLAERIGQSTDAYNDGSLAVDQFAVKNDTLGASIDKLQNSLSNLTTGPDSNFGKALKYVIDSFTDATAAADKMITRIQVGFSLLNQLAGKNFNPTSIINAAAADRSKNTIAANRDERIGAGITIADQKIAGTSNAKELRAEIVAAETLFAINKKRESNAKAFALDTKNSDEAIKGQVNRIKNELQPALLQQKATLDRLRTVYAALYGTKAAPGDGDAFKTDDKAKKAALAEAKRAEAAEKKARDSANRMIETSTKLGVSQLELNFAKGKQEVADEKIFEEAKFKLLAESYDAREKLYDKDSEEFQKIQVEKVDAETNYVAKIDKINKEAAEKALKDQEKAAKEKEKLDKSIAGANEAGRGIDGEKKIGGLGVKRASGKITDAEYNKELFAIRKQEIQDEIDAAQAQMDKFTEIDSEYFDAKRDRLKAEKDLVKEQSDYEIAQAEIVAQKKKENEQAVFDFVSELGGTLFSIGSDLGAARVEELEYQRDQELKLAGDNADAKIKIQANFDKKILAQKRKQAIYDKAEALFNIAINTAVGVSKVYGQTGIFGLAASIPIIIAGALQAATVLAKPLPKYKGGRKGGKAELATVNDGKGFELLESKEGYRIAGGGKETVTFLQKDEIVHPHEKSMQIVHEEFQNASGSDKFVDNLIYGQGILRAKEELNQKALISAFMNSRISKQDLIEAVALGLSELEIQQLFIDEKGHNTYLKRKNQMIHDQNSRNTFGGNG